MLLCEVLTNLTSKFLWTICELFFKCQKLFVGFGLLTMITVTSLSFDNNPKAVVS